MSLTQDLAEVPDQVSAILKIRLSSKYVPLALFTTTLVAYGLLIPFLGLYVDDWHHVYFSFTRGWSGLWDLFLYDVRPFAAYFYWAGFQVLGFKPLHWHIFTLALRGLAVIFTWMALKEIWPDHRRAVTGAALLFAVYPLYKQQALAVAYSLHWMGFLLYSLSIWAMARSLRDPGRFWLFTVLSIVTGAAHLLLIEYYSGIELIRPLLIALLVFPSTVGLWARLRKTLLLWLPYLLLLVGFFLYRFYLIPRPKPGFERNAPVLIFDFLKAPLSTSVRFVQIVFQETTAILYSVWNNVLNPNLFDFTQLPNLAGLVLIAFSTILLYLYIKSTRFESAGDSTALRSWVAPALGIGLALTILGALPAWVTDQFITVDNPLWSDRYGLPSMIGASLVVMALIYGLVRKPNLRILVLSVLVGLSIGWHWLNANEYRRSWIKQTDFFWQLYWRAPYIQPGTSFLSDGEVLFFMTEPSTSFALSTLYPKPNDQLPQDYWFFSLNRRFEDNMDELVKGMELKYRNNFSIFNGESRDSLVIFYEPQNYECLWVLRPEDTNLRVLPRITRDAAVISNLDRIQPDSPLAQPIPTDIFGPEPPHTWCYYYQKADLARQMGDWEQVVELWNQATADGYSPGNGVELLPFIDGFARTGDWKTAEEMTLQANRTVKVMHPILCPIWQAIEKETPASPERDRTLQNIYSRLCNSSG